MTYLRRHMCWQSKRFYWSPGGEQEGKGNQENCSASQSHRFYSDGISFQLVFSQLFWLRVLPGGARLIQPRWMPVRRILGGGRTCGVSFWPVLNSSSCWWLISSIFLTRTSCRKITHVNGDYGAWSEWVVPVSVLPLKHTDIMSVFPAYLN